MLQNAGVQMFALNVLILPVGANPLNRKNIYEIIGVCIYAKR